MYYRIMNTDYTTDNLYAALAKLRDERAGELVIDRSRSKTARRGLVAFWCGWREKVAAGFAANELERETLEELANNCGNGNTL